jgi:hypothetical protein
VAKRKNLGIVIMNKMMLSINLIEMGNEHPSFIKLIVLNNINIKHIINNNGNRYRNNNQEMC